MHLSLKRARRAAATAIAVAVAATGVLTAACTPQSAGYKFVSGTIKGADGKYVDALMGFDVLDSAGRRINLGSGVGYSSLLRVNHCAPASGSAAVQKCKRTGYVSTYKWSILLPPNASRLYIEVYPKDPSSSNWYHTATYDGPFPGTTDVSTYALTYKRALPLPSSLSGVKIVLPKSCGAPGGQTGGLAGTIAGWPQGKTGTANAWSGASNSVTSLGFGLGLVDATGHYTIHGLVPGQRYGIIAGTAGFSRNMVNYTNDVSSDNTLVPGACQTKTYNF
jgi:hypothetical protein